MGGGLGCGKGFDLLGRAPGVVKQRRLPTSSSRYSCGVELQRNLIFAASSGVIVRWESLSMESWGKFL